MVAILSLHTRSLQIFVHVAIACTGIMSSCVKFCRNQCIKNRMRAKWIFVIIKFELQWTNNEQNEPLVGAVWFVSWRCCGVGAEVRLTNVDKHFPAFQVPSHAECMRGNLKCWELFVSVCGLQLTFDWLKSCRYVFTIIMTNFLPEDKMCSIVFIV